MCTWSRFTLMAVLALAVSIHSEFMLGSTFRACRFLGFLAVLWLLSPWFGRRDMSLLRCHRICLIAVLTMVIAGAAISPGLAFSFDGRLSGVLWPIPATQVAHYAAVVFGTTAILWMCQVISGRNALVCVGLSAVALMGAHTRTALIATAVGLAVAGLSLFVGHSRVRRTSLWATVLVVVTLGVFANELKTWALRGQTSQEATDLTGRTKVWDAVFSAPRPRLNQIFGSGMSDMSFKGLPIDSNWVGTYFDQGWVGVVLDATALLRTPDRRRHARAITATGDRDLPHCLLPFRLDHGDRPQQPVAVPAGPGGGGKPDPAETGDGEMKTSIAHRRGLSRPPIAVSSGLRVPWMPTA